MWVLAAFLKSVGESALVSGGRKLKDVTDLKLNLYFVNWSLHFGRISWFSVDCLVFETQILKSWLKSSFDEPLYILWTYIRSINMKWRDGSRKSSGGPPLGPRALFYEKKNWTVVTHLAQG